MFSHIRKSLQILFILFLILVIFIHDCKGTCPRRNRKAIKDVNRKCGRRCQPDSPRCRNRKVCKCDHECGYSCIDPRSTCRRPPSVANMQSRYVKRNTSEGIISVSGPKYQYDDFIEYTCKPGYALRQSKPVMCHSKRRWTKKNVACYLVCEPKSLRDIARFNLTCGNSCLAHIDCYSHERCVCDGSCGRSCVNKVVNCGEAPASSDATINYTGRGFYRVAHYSCDEGFYLVSGSPSRKCTGGGSYDGSLPQCARIECSDPYVAFEATGGEVESQRPSTYSIGSIADFHCPSSHRLLGSTNRTCLIDGRWSGLDSVCDLIDTLTRCSHPGVPINGGIDTNRNFSVGSVVQFQCDPGYLMMGEEEQECMYFLQWSDGGVPQCLDPDVPSNNFQAIDRIRESLDAIQDFTKISRSTSRILLKKTEKVSEFYFFIDISKTEGDNCLHQTLKFFKDLLNKIYDETDENNVGVVVYATNATVLQKIKLEKGSTKNKILSVLKEVEMEKDSYRKSVGNTLNFSNALQNLIEVKITSTIEDTPLKTRRQIYFTTCGVSDHGDSNVGVSLSRNSIQQFKVRFNATFFEIFTVLVCDICRQPVLNTRESLLAIATSSEHLSVFKNQQSSKSLLHLYDNGNAQNARTEDEDDGTCGNAGDIEKLKNKFARVWHGNDAKRGAWPWHAMITSKAKNLGSLKRSVFGGGSLISHRWILTAAHLFEDVDRTDGWHRNYRVVLGVHKFPVNVKKFQKEVKMFETKTIIVHERFKTQRPKGILKDHDYDVALIKLGKESEVDKNGNFKISINPGFVNYTSLIQPVCLPCMKNSFFKRWLVRQEKLKNAMRYTQVSEGKCTNEGKVFTADSNSLTAIIGFGKTEKSSRTSRYLQQGRVSLKLSTECSQAIPHMRKIDLRTRGEIENNYTYTDRMICALGDNNGRIVDACQGDSGGSLTREIYDKTTRKGRWVQIGIVSWGYGCASSYTTNGRQRNFPGYYTNVFSVMNWIKSHINSEAVQHCNRPEHLLNIPKTVVMTDVGFRPSIGTNFRIECAKWHELVSGTTSWISNENGEWVSTNPSEQSSAMPVCKPICGVKNGGQGSLDLVSEDVAATRNEYPWMVFIHIGQRPNVSASQAKCGGSLISPEYVLTAAHCVTDLNTMQERRAEDVFVWLGVHDRIEDQSGNTPARSVRVSQIIRHPEYNLSLFDSDFALLRLVEHVAMNYVTRPICLPEPHSTRLDNRNVVGEVAGWGLGNVIGSSSTTLRKTTVPIATNQECLQTSQQVTQATDFENPIGLNITEHMFCAGSPTRTICPVTSGGPFMLPNSNNKYTTYGAVSFGISRDRCGQSLSHSVFAKLDDVMVTWVKTQASLN